MQENDNPLQHELTSSANTQSVPSALSESIAKDLDILERSLSGDIADLSKLRSLVQRLASAWAASDGSVREVLRDQSISRLRSKYPKFADLFERLAADANPQTAGPALAMEDAIRSVFDNLICPTVIISSGPPSISRLVSFLRIRRVKGADAKDESELRAIRSDQM